MSIEKHIQRSYLLLFQSMEIVCNRFNSTNTNRQRAQKMMMTKYKKKKRQKCTSKISNESNEWKRNWINAREKVELHRKTYIIANGRRSEKKPSTGKWSSMSMMVVNKIYFNLGIKSQIKEDQHTYNILIVLCKRCENISSGACMYERKYLYVHFIFILFSFLQSNELKWFFWCYKIHKNVLCVWAFLCSSLLCIFYLVWLKNEHRYFRFL